MLTLFFFAPICTFLLVATWACIPSLILVLKPAAELQREKKSKISWIIRYSRGVALLTRRSNPVYWFLPIPPEARVACYPLVPPAVLWSLLFVCTCALSATTTLFPSRCSQRETDPFTFPEPLNPSFNVFRPLIDRRILKLYDRERVGRVFPDTVAH